MDIATCFDDIKHDLIFYSLVNSGLSAPLVWALAREYSHLRADAKLACTLSTGLFDYRRGGRQGGTETPSLLNIILDVGLFDMVRSWQERGLGFSFGNPGGSCCSLDLLNLGGQLLDLGQRLGRLQDYVS